MNHYSAAARAKQNGSDAQNYVYETFGAFCLNGATIDTLIAGIPVEVKSCMEYIVDRSCSRRRRHGRVVFREDQHQALKDCCGRYLIVVCRERNDPETEPLEVVLKFLAGPDIVDRLCPGGFARAKGISWEVLRKATGATE